MSTPTNFLHLHKLPQSVIIIIQLSPPHMLPTNLPNNHPAEAVTISPEALEVANCYLTTQSHVKVAEDLGLPETLVLEYLSRPEVTRYIDQVFFDQGFNNRFMLRKAMDTLISRKFQELDEAEVGSSKDIADLLALSHKMTMEQLDRQIQLEKLKDRTPTTQTNIQINDLSNHQRLLERLLQSKL